MTGLTLLTGLGVFAVRQSLAQPVEKAYQASGKDAGQGKAAGSEKADADNDKAPGEKTATDKKEPAGAIENPFPKRFPAASIDGGTGWLNTSRELSLKDLRGKVVLIDFWTYCCINCMHVLPDLKYLEHKYSKELVVIGCHSAKFDNEKDSENIRRAIMRYEIEHPVINDSEMTVWRKFNVRSWPTLVLIDPEGNYCGYISGEGNREVLDTIIERLIAYHKSKGTLNEKPIKFDLEREKAEPTPLRFPGKVLADAASNRLFISDSNHNRIVVTDLAGKLQYVIGTGAIGRENGPYNVATFDHPQGMALNHETLYVADTENHEIRAIDLKTKEVTSLAGTGKQASHRTLGGPMHTAALNSPWDLVYLKDKLYIAMAGPHQLWVLDLHTKSIKPFAGTGSEDIVNGSLDSSAFAQPSGIVTDGKSLYVVDSEGSSVRRLVFATGEVSTIVGTSDLPQGRCLFEFGDKDGVGDLARLQHPLGIAIHGGSLFVADSYNQKIKLIDISKGESKTFLGDGTAGDRDSPARFSEPAGLSIAKNILYIADTNNHLIRMVDLKTSKVSTLTIEGLKPPAPAVVSGAESPADETIKVDLQKIAAGESVELEIALPIPEGFKLNKLAPISYQLQADADQKLIPRKLLGQRKKVPVPDLNALTIHVPLLAARSGKADVQVTVSYSYCKDGDAGVCKLSTVKWKVPLEIAADATNHEVRLEAK